MLDVLTLSIEETNMSPEAMALLQAEERTANERITEIDIKIGHLLADRYRIEQGLHRVVDLIIEHADLIVEVPMQRKEQP